MSIEKAIKILQTGGLVAMPTETVYGLAADAQNPAALRKIFLAKQRPMDHPLIVHLAEMSLLPQWVKEVPAPAWVLAERFWPGPLTLIFKKASHVQDWVTGGQETVGIRIPHHPVALALLQGFGGGLAAPSANRFGRISPTTAEAVREELGDAVDLILEGGQCAVGVESTIIDVSGELPTLLRPGMITVQAIEAVLRQPVRVRQDASPRVSGSHEQHYAPVTKTYLLSREKITEKLFNVTKRVGLIAFPHPGWVLPDHVKLVTLPRDPLVYAHELYSVLRELDKQGWNEIWLEAVPMGVEWDGIRDRLQRASCRGEANLNKGLL